MVHCRDLHTGSAAREFLFILEDFGLTDPKIHFTGNAVEAIEWMDRLLNVKLVVPKV